MCTSTLGDFRANGTLDLLKILLFFYNFLLVYFAGQVILLVKIIHDSFYYLKAVTLISSISQLKNIIKSWFLL